MSVNPDYRRRLREVSTALDETPFTVLIWGPGVPADSAPGRKRERLRDYLQSVLGRAATVVFSEDLEEQIEELAGRQDAVAEYIQLRAADAVVLIPESVGSVTESALFTAELRSKCIAFVERRERKGFARNAYLTLKIELVEREEWNECTRVTRLARDYVEQLRLEKFKKTNRSGFDWEE
jgi:hypothetical protein